MDKKHVSKGGAVLIAALTIPALILGIANRYSQDKPVQPLRTDFMTANMTGNANLALRTNIFYQAATSQPANRMGGQNPLAAPSLSAK